MSSVAFGASATDVNANIAQAIEDYGYDVDLGFTMTAVISAKIGQFVTLNNENTWYLFSQQNQYFGLTTGGDPGSWNYPDATSGSTSWEGIINEGDKTWLVGPKSTGTLTLRLACTGVLAGDGEGIIQYTTSIQLLAGDGLNGEAEALITAQIMDSEGLPTKYLDLNHFAFDTNVTEAYLGIYSADGKQVGDIDIVNYVAPVPEPTTATLSLLALTGLAARRCRK